MADFKLTYATMFNPPEELHKGFDKAVAKLKANLGKEYGMIIDGKDVFADEKYEDRSPVNTDWVLAVMQKGNATQATMAIEAARCEKLRRRFCLLRALRSNCCFSTMRIRFSGARLRGESQKRWAKFRAS